MPRSLTLLACLLALIFVAACSKSDKNPPSASVSSPSATAAGRTPTPTATAGAATGTPSDQKTPSNETPGQSVTPAPATSAGPKPTPAAEGTPAPAPPDQIAFLNKFANDTIEYNNCTFDPTTLVVDCESRGRYAVNPPLTGQDIVCRVGSVNGTPRLINCTSQEPLQAIYYEIPS